MNPDKSTTSPSQLEILTTTDGQELQRRAGEARHRAQELYREDRAPEALALLIDTTHWETELARRGISLLQPPPDPPHTPYQPIYPWNPSAPVEREERKSHSKGSVGQKKMPEAQSLFNF